MNKVLFIILVLFYCDIKKDSKKNFVFENLLNPTTEFQTFFSYPGRLEDIPKKRNVIEAVLKLIRETKSTLDIYAYSFNNPEIIDELIKAKTRGVKINFILDSDQNYSLLLEKKFSFKIWKSTGLYHVKAIYSDEQNLFIGTGNFSRYGLTNDYNGYIQVQVETKNKKKVKEFIEEKYSEPILFLNQMFLVNSPDYGLLIQDKILKEVREAKSTIHYLTFDHTDAVLTHSLREASKKGIEVIGIYDSPTDAEGVSLQEEFYGISSSIYRDGNEDKVFGASSFPEGGILHHKTIIIDNKKLITGSYNFSSNARDNNRELFIYTENMFLVSEFAKEFTRIKNSSYKLPKKNYYLKEEKILIQQNNVFSNKILLPEKIDKPIVEFGNFFKTYLFYQKTFSTNTFFINEYSSISNGVSYSGDDDFLSLNFYLNQMNIYDRESNRVYFNSKENSSKFLSQNVFKKISIDYISFNSSNHLLFQAPLGLNLEEYKFEIWIPKTGTRFGSLEKFDSVENLYLIKTDIPVNRRNYMAIILSKDSENLFFCIQKENYRDKGKEFLHNKIFAEEYYMNLNTKYSGCFVSK